MTNREKTYYTPIEVDTKVDAVKRGEVNYETAPAGLQIREVVTIGEDGRAFKGNATNLFMIPNIETLRKTIGKEGEVVTLSGYYTAGDKDPINYKWTNDTSKEDNGGSIITSIRGRWEAVSNVLSILDFGIKNSKTLNQSIKLDNFNKYVDDNEIYELDFLGFHIMSSQTIHFKTPRGAEIRGNIYKKLHKIKNLNIYSNKVDVLKQGACNIIFAPSKNYKGVFELDNVVFDSYNPNYSLTSFESDGHCIGFVTMATVNYNPEGTLRAWIQTDIEYVFNNIEFISPAVSYNITTADVLAKKITITNCKGDFLGLYFNCNSYDISINNLRGVYRDDLHEAGRLLVTSLYHEEPEIANNTITRNSIKITNCEAYKKSTGLAHIVFKNHTLGKHIIKEIIIDNCKGNIMMYSPLSEASQLRSEVDYIKISNFNKDYLVDFVIKANVFILDNVVNTNVVSNSIITTLVWRNTNISKSLSYSGQIAGTITNLIIDNCTSNLNGTSVPISTYGIVRNRNVTINSVLITNSVWVANRMLECNLSNITINNTVVNSLSMIDFILVSNTTGNNVSINLNNFIVNGKQEPSTNLFTTLDATVILTFNISNSVLNFNNTISTTRVYTNYKNTTPLLRATTVNLPLFVNSDNAYIGTEVYDTTVGKVKKWNGTIWTEPLVTKSTNVINIATADATDLATALVLINELKVKLNSKLDADRASGQQLTI